MTRLRQRRRKGAIWIAAVALCVYPATAGAQAADERPVRRLEMAVGFGLFGGARLGAGDANLRANNVSPQPFRLFSAESSFARASVVEARLSTALTRRFEVEGRVSLSRPELRVSITADVENAPGLTVVERIDQYVIDAGLLVLFDEARLARMVPFASAGAGYLRQLHEGLTVIESGRLYHVGGGLKHWFVVRQTGLVRAAGLRVDGRLYLLDGGIALEDRPRSHGAISGSLFVTF